jgi:hypothetical protein
MRAGVQGARTPVQSFVNAIAIYPLRRPTPDPGALVFRALSSELLAQCDDTLQRQSDSNNALAVNALSHGGWRSGELEA